MVTISPNFPKGHHFQFHFLWANVIVTNCLWSLDESKWGLVCQGRFTPPSGKGVILPTGSCSQSEGTLGSSFVTEGPWSLWGMEPLPAAVAGVPNAT